MTLLVRDEEEILADNLDFHLAHGVDFVIVTDNNSTDRTPEILREYVDRGRVRVINEPADDYDQAAWVTRMARMAAEEYGADWVIHADADEFWWPKSGDLRQSLSSIPDQVGVLEVGRSNFLPMEGDGPFHQRMVVREVVSKGPFGDPLQPKVCHRGHAGAQVAQGNHSVTGVPGRLMPASSATPLFILHFPLRGYAQFEHKVVTGGQAYERNTKVPWVTGSGWRSRYEDYKAGRLPDWWRQQIVDNESINEGIAAGSLVVDRRLAAYFCPAAADRVLVVAPRPPGIVPVAGAPPAAGGTVRSKTMGPAVRLLRRLRHLVRERRVRHR